MTDPLPDVPEFSTDAKLRPRDVRRLAMQALFTLDAMAAEALPERPAGTPHSAAAARASLRQRDQPAAAPVPAYVPDPEDLLEALEEPFDDGEPAVPVEPKIPAVELALAAWAVHEQADEQCSKLAPEWPTHRQPPIDRAILRLAWFEMTTGRTDPALAINEALELAKQFSDEKSPPFLNGVLDRIAKRLPPRLHPPATTPGTGGDPWLRDAVQD